MWLLYGRAGRLTEKNGGFRPGQEPGSFYAVNLALGRIVTLHYLSSTLYQIR
jgi:hypothetical protein